MSIYSKQEVREAMTGIKEHTLFTEPPSSRRGFSL